MDLLGQPGLTPWSSTGIARALNITSSVIGAIIRFLHSTGSLHEEMLSKSSSSFKTPSAHCVAGPRKRTAVMRSGQTQPRSMGFVPRPISCLNDMRSYTDQSNEPLPLLSMHVSSPSTGWACFLCPNKIMLDFCWEYQQRISQSRNCVLYREITESAWWARVHNNPTHETTGGGPDRAMIL